MYPQAVLAPLRLDRRRWRGRRRASRRRLDQAAIRAGLRRWWRRGRRNYDRRCRNRRCPCGKIIDEAGKQAMRREVTRQVTGNHITIDGIRLGKLQPSGVEVTVLDAEIDIV